MGFSTLLDILGSTLVGGMLLLILFRMSDASVKNTYLNGGELIVQQNLAEVVRVIEYDFRKIGYCKNYNMIPDPSKSIVSATNNSITFLTDVAVPGTYPEGDGIVDTIHYYLGSPNDLLETPNPIDRMLYRVVNNETPRGSNLGITMFNLSYFGPQGDLLPTPVSNPGAIASIRIDLEVQDPIGYQDKYPSVFWRQIRMTAKNLNNR